MNIVHLIKTGRVEPILISDGFGVTMLHGWRRKGKSRKGGEWTLKKPQAWIDRRKIAAGTALSPGCQIIMDRRKRQVRDLGGDDLHDQYTAGELAAAGECYLLEDRERIVRPLPGATPTEVISVPIAWPFAASEWRAGNRILELSLAGAYFLAEGMRLRRQGKEEGAQAVEARSMECAKIIDDYYGVGPLSPGEELIDISKFKTRVEASETPVDAQA